MTPAWLPSVRSAYLEAREIVRARKYQSVSEHRAMQMATNAYLGDGVDSYAEAARLARKAAIIDEVWEKFAAELAKWRER